MKLTIEKTDNRWLVNGKKWIDMSRAERAVLNTFFKEIKEQYLEDSINNLNNIIKKQ